MFVKWIDWPHTAGSRQAKKKQIEFFHVHPPCFCLGESARKVTPRACVRGNMVVLFGSHENIDVNKSFGFLRGETVLWFSHLSVPGGG